MSAASSGTSVVSPLRVISVPPEVFVRRADVPTCGSGSSPVHVSVCILLLSPISAFRSLSEGEPTFHTRSRLVYRSVWQTLLRNPVALLSETSGCLRRNRSEEPGSRVPIFKSDSFANPPGSRRVSGNL